MIDLQISDFDTRGQNIKTALTTVAAAFFNMVIILGHVDCNATGNMYGAAENWLTVQN